MPVMQSLNAGSLYLILGLGNPGLQYRLSRHNFGFLLLDQVQRKSELLSSFIYLKDCQAELSVGRLAGNDVCLVKPQTYMNLSGQALQTSGLKDFIPAEPGRIIVVHDDLDLPLGRIKLKKGGGNGGHNGVRSVMEVLGCADFLRLRLGISGPLRTADTIDYVLAAFSQEESSQVADVLDSGAHALMQILASGVDKAMNQINRREAE